MRLKSSLLTRAVCFPTMTCVYREEEVVVVGKGWCGGGGDSCAWAEPSFASGIAMVTGALFIESLSCSRSPAVYHSLHMLEAKREQCSAQPNCGTSL